jgi:metal-responsive CopG/Arc/MetJ family transcriptional regulator
MSSKVENFSLPSELVKKLNVFSKESMIPKSRLIKRLLEDFFEKNEKEQIAKKDI